MKLAPADRNKLSSLLDELARSVEELLLSGLTTASEATRQALNISFQEASRLRLLRLGSTLRAAAEELGRYTRNDADFSRKRLTFFLNRAWLLSHGLARALREENEKEFDRLTWMPANEPVERLEVVTLGVAKKVTTAFCAFEFRLRTIQASGSIEAGRRLSWSCIFPLKPGVTIPAEGFLHLPQKQKFNASLFLEGKELVLEKVAVALDEFGGGRINLGDQSTVTAGKAFADWQRFQSWDAVAALERIRNHQPGPFDLEVELQEEIVLAEWDIAKAVENAEGQVVYPVEVGQTAFDVMVSPGSEGKALRKSLEEQRKKKQRPPLFGLLHYEKCRLMLQPLSVFGKDQMDYLTISDEKLDRAALLKALKFT